LFIRTQAAVEIWIMIPSIQDYKNWPGRGSPLSLGLLVLFLIAVWQAPCVSAQTPLFHDLVWKPAFSPDASKAIVMDGTELRVVEVKTGKVLNVIKGHEFVVYAAAYSPDGQRIISGDGNCLRLWDARTGKQILRLEGRNGNLSSLAITPDGRYAVSGHSEGSGIQSITPMDLFLWDLKTGKVVSEKRIILRRFAAQQLASGFYRFFPDTARDQLPLSVLDLLEGPAYGEVCRFEGQQHVNCVAISPDGKHVICGCLDGNARILDVRTGSETCSLAHQAIKGVRGVAFSPDGGHVLVGTGSGGVHLWRVRGATEVRTFRGHKDAVYSVAFSPNGQRALSGGEDQTVRLWDLKNGKELACFRELKGRITSVAFLPDGKSAACADDEGKVRQWKLPE
jgi:tricorn protease-like protein